MEEEAKWTDPLSYYENPCTLTPAEIIEVLSRPEFQLDEPWTCQFDQKVATTNIQQDEHILLKCKFIQANCPFCGKTMEKGKIAPHWSSCSETRLLTFRTIEFHALAFRNRLYEREGQLPY